MLHPWTHVWNAGQSASLAQVVYCEEHVPDSAWVSHCVHVWPPLLLPLLPLPLLLPPLLLPLPLPLPLPPLLLPLLLPPVQDPDWHAWSTLHALVHDPQCWRSYVMS